MSELWEKDIMHEEHALVDSKMLLLNEDCYTFNSVKVLSSQTHENLLKLQNE